MSYPMNFGDTELEQAFNAGFEARMANEPRSANPFDSNSFQAWNAWNDGFGKACLEVEERRESFLFQEEQPDEVEDAAD